MTQQEIQDEILKCMQSPYYFATKYIKVKNHRQETVSFTTLLSEEQFNKIFKQLQKQMKREIKTINFKNRTWEQIRSSYINLQNRYKTVKFPKAISNNGLYNGEFLVF